MIKILTSLILLSVIHLETLAQFPISKNIEIAKSEIKNSLKAKGYSFLEEHTLGKDLFVIAYSEEFRVTLSINDYKNVESVNFISKKISTFIKLQKSFSFSEWEYIGESKNKLGEVESIYHYKKYKIRMDTKSQQFVVSLINDY